MLAAIRKHGSGVPGTVKAYRQRGGLLWRWLFVPLYRRVPWPVKARAMQRAADDRVGVHASGAAARASPGGRLGTEPVRAARERAPSGARAGCRGSRSERLCCRHSRQQAPRCLESSVPFEANDRGTRMHSNSWLAIDVGTAPMVRAQELRFAWERFVDEIERGDDEEEDPEFVREAIADSWRRSFAAGVAPTGNRFAPVIADEEETHDLWENHPLGPRGAADPQLPVGDRRRGRIPDRDQRRRRRPALHRGQRGDPHAGRRGHELRRGHAVERARRRHQRDRHRGRARPRGAGVRARALPRAGAALGLLGRADPRSRQRIADRRDRPDGRLQDRPPGQPRRRHRDRGGRRGLAAARPPGARRAPARPLRRRGDARARHDRPGGAVRPADHAAAGELGREGPPDDPARRRRARAARTGRTRSPSP